MTDIALTKSELIAEAIAHGGSLGEKDHEFLQSLISQYVEKEKLSEKQWYWVGKLVERAMLTKEAKGVPEFEERPGLFAPIMALFDKAGDKLKTPTIVIHNEEGTIALVKGKDQVYVKAGAGYYEQLFGRLNRYGDFSANHLTKPGPNVYRLLLQLADNPVRAAQNSAKLSGKCSFCNSGLEDPKSIAAGYGPTCAKHFSLPWG